MLSPSQRNPLIDKIEALPALVRKAVEGAGDAELETTYRDGGWTIRQVVHHLADSHINAYMRTRLILTEDNPTLRPYSQDDWANLDDATHSPIEPSLRILEGIHERWTAVLRNAAESAWSRTAVHPEYGATSLVGLLKTYSTHGEDHLEHIRLGRERYAKK